MSRYTNHEGEQMNRVEIAAMDAADDAHDRKHETKHAPGPWHVGGVSTPTGMEPYCNVWGPVPKGKQSGEMVACDVAPNNANLIAAAPEMFEALRLARDLIHAEICNGGPCWIRCKDAESALAKARGGK